MEAPGIEGGRTTRASPVVEGSGPKSLAAPLENSGPGRPATDGTVTLSQQDPPSGFIDNPGVTAALSDALSDWVRLSNASSLVSRLAIVLRMLGAPSDLVVLNGQQRQGQPVRQDEDDEP